MTVYPVKVALDQWKDTSTEIPLHHRKPTLCLYGVGGFIGYALDPPRICIFLLRV